MKNTRRKPPWTRFELQAQVIQSLAHPIRLAIVDLLRAGEVCVCDIAAAVGSERSNVSRHLAVMSRGGVVRTRKEGLKVYYSLCTPCVLEFMACATRTLEVDLDERSRALTDA
jgi:DNA-binding transcriptional ArsR family regulator